MSLESYGRGEMPFRELSVDEYRRMLEGVQQVIQPYMRRKLEVMEVTIPVMTITRTEDGVTMTTSYPPGVQELFDRCDSMCRLAVAQYLRQEGYTLPEQGQ